MKILHVNFSDNKGGAAISVMRLHSFLLSKGIDSNLLVSDKEIDDENIISINKTSEKIYNILKSTINRNLSIVFKTANKNTHSLNLIPSKLLKIINNFKADIVNLHWIGNETLSIKQISKIESKVVWTIHDMWPFCGAEHYTFDLRYKDGYERNNRPVYEKGIDLNRYIWNQKNKYFYNIKKIHCTSKWMYDRLQESKLFKKAQIAEIPLLLDQTFWTKITDSNTARKILGLDKNKKIITFGSDNYLGNERKGFSYFLEIIKKFRDNNNYQFVVFGENNFQKLNRVLNKSNLDSVTINLGKISDNQSLRLLYSATDLIISPSTLESYGLIVSEAQHMGTPSLIFQNTGSTSIVEHKITGYVAKYKSLEDMFEGMSWCIDNLKNKVKISELITKKFDSSKIMNKYLNFLNQ